MIAYYIYLIFWVVMNIDFDQGKRSDDEYITSVISIFFAAPLVCFVILYATLAYNGYKVNIEFQKIFLACYDDKKFNSQENET